MLAAASTPGGAAAIGTSAVGVMVVEEGKATMTRATTTDQREAIVGATAVQAPAATEAPVAAVLLALPALPAEASITTTAATN